MRWSDCHADLVTTGLGSQLGCTLVTYVGPNILGLPCTFPKQWKRKAWWDWCKFSGLTASVLKTGCLGRDAAATSLRPGTRLKIHIFCRFQCRCSFQWQRQSWKSKSYDFGFWSYRCPQWTRPSVLRGFPYLSTPHPTLAIFPVPDFFRYSNPFATVPIQQSIFMFFF